jgi:AcrR family transcriptional regulator
MPALQPVAFRPRKQPVQTRSGVTFDAILEATIQVLLEVGYPKLTTTRVAQRAGVSVGTLYQYFPNRQVLIAATIERHLETLAVMVEEDCARLAGFPLHTMVAGLVDVLIRTKLERADLSRALQSPLADIGGAPLVRRAADRVVEIVGQLLESCADIHFENTSRVAFFVVTSVRAVLQAALVDPAREHHLEGVRGDLAAMVEGYLRGVAA